MTSAIRYPTRTAVLTEPSRAKACRHHLLPSGNVMHLQRRQLDGRFRRQFINIAFPPPAKVTGFKIAFVGRISSKAGRSISSPHGPFFHKDKQLEGGRAGNATNISIPILEEDVMARSESPEEKPRDEFGAVG